MVEVDHHVAQHHDVGRRHVRPRPDEVHHPEADHPPQVVAHDPVGAVAGEVADEEVGGQAAVHLELGVAALPASCHRVLGEVAREDRHVPARELGEGVDQQHGEAVGLLAGRAGCRPDREAALGGAAGDQPGDDGRGERVEGVAVTEPGRLVRGHRLDDVVVHPAVRLVADPRDHVGDRGEPGALGDGSETAVDQVVLARFEHERR